MDAVDEMRKDTLQVLIEGLEKWIKINCYLGFIWVGFQMLQFLPVHIAERVIEAFLGKLGI